MTWERTAAIPPEIGARGAVPAGVFCAWERDQAAATGPREQMRAGKKSEVPLSANSKANDGTV